MLRATSVFGLLGAAALLTVVSHPLAKRSFQAVAAADTTHAIQSVKGDRLVQPAVARVPLAASSVEIVSGPALNLVVRAADGAVVYRIDGSEGTTSIAKDADIPAVTIRAGAEPTVRRPATQPSAQQVPMPALRPVNPTRVGCENAISSLVSAEARRMLPGRCLV